MASVPQGDVIGNKHPISQINAFAAVASNGAGALLGTAFGPFPWPMRIKNAWFVPTSGDTTATKSASYRLLTLVNAGPAGTGTATLASYINSVTSPSLTPIAMVVPTTTVATVPSGVMLQFSQATVGGNDANGTVLPGGTFAIAYEII